MGSKRPLCMTYGGRGHISCLYLFLVLSGSVRCWRVHLAPSITEDHPSPLCPQPPDPAVPQLYLPLASPLGQASNDSILWLRHLAVNSAVTWQSFGISTWSHRACWSNRGLQGSHRPGLGELPPSSWSWSCCTKSRQALLGGLLLCVSCFRNLQAHRGS